MAKALDDIDIKRLQEPRHSPTEDDTMCLHCQKKIIPLTMSRIHRRGVSLLRLLDDEGVVEKYDKPPPGSISSGRDVDVPTSLNSLLPRHAYLRNCLSSL